MVTFCVCVITWIPGFIFWKMRWSWTCLSIHIIFMCHVMCNLYLPHNSHVFLHLVFIAFSKKPPNMTLPICTESCQNVNRFHVNVILFCVNKITWWIFGIIPALILWSISYIYLLAFLLCSIFVTHSDPVMNWGYFMFTHFIMVFINGLYKIFLRFSLL